MEFKSNKMYITVIEETMEELTKLSEYFKSDILKMDHDTIEKNMKRMDMLGKKMKFLKKTINNYNKKIKNKKNTYSSNGTNILYTIYNKDELSDIEEE